MKMLSTNQWLYIGWSLLTDSNQQFVCAETADLMVPGCWAEMSASDRQYNTKVTPSR